MELEQALREFYTRYQGIGLFSTGARVVDFEGVLYNVDGSRRDPKIGKNWKGLLLRSGINGDCYATTPLPDGVKPHTHPQFKVGGHMTPSAVGYVEPGGICYIMPLCSWHNSKWRDRKPFEHEETRMLELSGYMEGELAATFLARTPGGPEYRLVSVEGDALTNRAFEVPQIHLSNAHRDLGAVNPALPRTYLRFRQIVEDGSVRFVIDDARLP